MSQNNPVQLLKQVHPQWLPALMPVADQLKEIEQRLAQHPQDYLPAPHQIMRAFEIAPERVRVVIIGQDPYPGADHACGLAFSVPKQLSKVPASLRNIYQELQNDLGFEPPSHGDLSHWSDQGVMLLNRILTTNVGESLGHKDFLWERISDAAIEYMGALAKPPVMVLWGNYARQLASLVPDAPIIASAHPSPLSARRGFFDSKPFSRINELLVARGDRAIDWQIADEDQLW